MTRSLCRAFLVLATGLAGCSVTSVPIHGSDGKPYVYVDCSGMFHSLDDCYQLANTVCPAGYRLVNSVAPRSDPFATLVIDCQEPGAMTPSSAPTPAVR
jgi:hypothetical protein